MNAAASVVNTKALATCKARCALRGVTLHALEGDDGKPLFVASRWALTKSFAELAEVDAWLARFEGGLR